MPPEGTTSGNAARRLDKRFGITTEIGRMYRIQVPVVNSDGRRELQWYPVLLPHEEVAKDFAEPGRAEAYLAHVRDPSPAPPAFHEHPVVKAVGAHRCAPLMVFIDAAGYTRLDSFVAFLVGSIHDGHRLCCAV
eukprot:8360413-Alexandrium_andersonii.AAC.1